MAKLQRDLSVSVRMHEIDNASKSIPLFVVPQTRTGWCDARIRRYTGHFGTNHGRTSHRPARQMNEVKIIWYAIVGHVGRHGRHDYAILEGQSTHRKRREHRRNRMIDAAARREPFLDAFHVMRVPHFEVFMPDALASG